MVAPWKTDVSPMKTAALAWLALFCCVAVPLTARAASPEDEKFVQQLSLDITKRSQSGEAPACQVDRPEALAGGRVNIRPGETLCLRLRDGRPEPVALAEAKDAAETLVVSAWQQGGFTILTVKNPLSHWMRYRAWIQRHGRDATEYTSTCPVMDRHRVGIEYWNYAIDEVVLSGFELEPDPDPASKAAPRMECR